MTAGCIIFLMQTGFALLESGTVRFKNQRNVMLKNLMDAVIGAFVWYAFGFGIAFGLKGNNTFIGTQYFFGSHISDDDAPGFAFWFF